MRFVSVGLPVCLPIVARQRLGKHIPKTTKNCWRRRFLCYPCLIKGESVGLCIRLPLLGNGSVSTSHGNEELLEASYSMRSISYQRKVGD
jgi:hypothetical protein